MTSVEEFKDLFSRQSGDYARYRPTYPRKLFHYLASLLDSHDLAWDVGTGSGQAAIALAAHFSRVVATDPSEAQISNAATHGRVEFRVDTADESPFAASSVDLIAAAQSFHWFPQKEFFEEARRVMRPQAVLAIWCYDLCKITPEIDTVMRQLHYDVLGDYWLAENRMVERRYKDVIIPMKEVAPPVFEMTAEWTLDHLVGYIGTWSALQTYIREGRREPLERTVSRLRAVWGEAEKRKVQWKLGLRVAVNG